MKYKSIAGGICFLIFALTVRAWAVESSLWEQNAKTEFEAGDPEGVSILAPGKIVLAPEAQTTNINARYSWALAEARDGQLFVGTGSDGKIFKVSRKGEAEVFAELQLQQVFALAVGDKGALFAAGFPGGKIYVIDSAGQISDYFDTGQSAVWALFLNKDGVLFAGTGDDGKIYRVNGPNDGAVLYDSRERRILSLAGDETGKLYAGTDQKGIIYRFDSKGDVSVLYDTELEEVTALLPDGEGSLYAVSAPGDLFMKMPPPQVAPVLPKAAPEMSDVEEMVSGAVPGFGAPSLMPLPGMSAMPSQKKRTCFVYRIERNGAASKFWTSPEQLIFSLVFSGKGLLAGSGDEGIIYVISPTGEAGTFYKTDQKQVLALHETKDGAIVAGLGNDASVVHFEGTYSTKGTYYSQVHDAEAVSRWGRVFWEADVPSGTKMTVATRSGNSQSPDDTWSDWWPKDGASEHFVSSSPGARFIQWRAVLESKDTNKTPELRKMTVAYLQRNQAPKVQALTIGISPPAPKETPGMPDIAAAMKALASGAACPPSQDTGNKVRTTTDGVKAGIETHESRIKFQWQAQDENDDKLEYTVYVKGVEEQNWKLLEKELTDNSYIWDTESVPDGDYHVKVVASDKLSNPEETALQAEKVSEPLTVDNTAPIVSGLKAAAVANSSRFRITGTVSDTISPVRSAQYSVDAGKWIPVLPEDGIFDSLAEKIQFETEELEKGEHSVVLKAVDYFGNVGAGKVIFFRK